MFEIILADFPNLHDEYMSLYKEGFLLDSFSYQGNVQTDHERLEIILRNGSIKHLISQGRGHYAGGYSRVTSKTI